MTTLTAVVCTYDRYDLARDSVEALIAAKKRTKGDRFQILIVDNTPKARRKKQSWKQSFITVTKEDVPGLSNARNRGISECKTDLIAFVDDDALVDADWAANVLKFFDEHSEAMAVGGFVEPLFDGCDRPAWLDAKLSEFLSCLDYGDVCRKLRPGEYIVGANMGFRKEVFDRFGMFDATLGRQGNSGLLSNEEVALLKNFKNETYYDPAIRAQHRIPPARVQQGWFRKRVVWQAISDALAGSTSEMAALRDEWSKIVSAAPAELRSLALLSAPCGTAEEFHRQLRGVYLHTQLALAGF